MKKGLTKNLAALALCSFTFGLGFGLNNVAFSDGAATPKVAYVNVGQLLASSKTIKAAEEAKAKQTQEMLKWYDSASADIQKQQTQKGKEDLIKKYEAQLTTKKKTIKEAYAKKINEVDAQLDKAITDKSKALGYDLVFRKESILVGGDDITAQILPLVK